MYNLRLNIHKHLMECLFITMRHTTPSRKEIVSWIWNNSYAEALRTRISKIRNCSTHRNTSNRKTEHRQSHIRDVAEDPNLGTYSDWGLSGVWLLINIYHIIYIHIYIYICIYIYTYIHIYIYKGLPLSMSEGIFGNSDLSSWTRTISLNGIHGLGNRGKN